MARSSVLGNAANTAAGWLFACICIGGSVLYFDDIRAAGRKAFGVKLPHEAVAAATPTSSQDDLGASTSNSTGSVELSADRMGHFLTSAQVNGSSIDVMVDTGASMVALTWEDAQRAGLYVGPSDFTLRASTANGQARFAPVTIESVSIGAITVRDVKGAVAEPGKLNATLLGMSFLGRLSRAEMRRGTLILEE